MRQSIAALGLGTIAVLGLAAPARAGATQTFMDKAAFLAATGASSATGPLPDIGYTPSATLGSVTLSIAPGGDDLFIGTAGTTAAPDWTPLLPGHDIAQGFEAIQVDTVAPVFSLGLDFVQPDLTMPDYGGTPIDSTFEVTLYDGACLVGQVQFTSIPTDVATFLGVWNSVAFDRALIYDVTDSIFVDDDEFYGEFYTGTTAAPAATVTACTDKAAFLAGTGASSATGPLPDLGEVTSATVGSVTFSIAPGGDDLAIGSAGTLAAPDWTTVSPGQDIAQGFEALQVDAAAPVFALGFDFVQPDATVAPWGGTPVDSLFEITLYDGATLVGSRQFASIPTDVETFLGVCSDTAFDRVEIRDITDDPDADDDEYFGEFYTSAQSPIWTDLGFALAGVAGDPVLAGTGTLTPGTAGSIELSNAAPSAPAVLFIALAGSPTPFKCGTLVPVPVLVSIALATSPAGSIPLAWPCWPDGLSGASLHFQYGVKDLSAVCGAALSNALRADVP